MRERGGCYSRVSRRDRAYRMRRMEYETWARDANMHKQWLMFSWLSEEMPLRHTFLHVDFIRHENRSL